jgi:hypothetical protein
VRLAGVAALLAALVLAAPVRAQDGSEARPVAGGGSFNGAPLLEPGVTYRDTLLLGEYNYYAFELGSGQRLHVDVRVPDVELETWERGQDAFAVNLHTPQREQVSTPVDEDIAGNGNSDQAGVTAANVDEKLRWEFYGPRTEPFLSAAEDLNEYIGPGTWYVSLHSVKANDREEVAELPVEVTLAAEGEPVPEEPDPTPTPSATPAPGATPESGGSDDGGGPSPLAVLALARSGWASAWSRVARSRAADQVPGTVPARC